MSVGMGKLAADIKLQNFPKNDFGTSLLFSVALFFMILFTLIIHRMGEIQHLNRLEQTILMKCYEGRSPLLSTKTHFDITH